MILSKMIPAIKKLIFDLADNLLLIINNSLFENIDELIDTLPIKTNNEKVISNFIKKKISIKNSLDTFEIFNKIRDNIYSILIFYQNILNDLGLMTVLLDFYYKNLNFIDDKDEKQQIIQKLHNEYNEISNKIMIS